MRFKLPLALLSAALACSLSAMPAQAQRARVFVASYGSDTNPCTFGSPCRSFQAAVNAVAAGGEVTAIDSAGFQPVNITKSVTITSPAGVEAGIAAAPGGSAISIGTGAGAVVLRGLTIDGAGSALSGINASAGTDIEIYDCAIRNFADFGIYVSSPAAASVVISNTIVTDINSIGSAAGIKLVTNGGAMIATLDQVIADNNAQGVETYAGNGALELSIANSHLDNNQTAIALQGTSVNSTTTAVLNDVTLNLSSDATVEFLGNAKGYFREVTQTTAPGFNNTTGIVFVQGSNNLVFGDGTNHFDGGTSGVTFGGSWVSQ